MKRVLRLGYEYVEQVVDRVFGARANPFNQLGALGWFFYWIVAATGIYLYIFFDTGVTDAYQSVQWITVDQWYAGGVIRSLHRYASDALVVVVLLHLTREFAWDRMKGARWLSWVTGVPLLWLLLACGISGYWVVWDTLAQYIAIGTTEWLDSLGIFGEPIARNFVNPAALSGRFFTLMVFMHIFLPLFMLFVMWVHIQRLALPRVNPDRRLMAGSLLALTALSLIQPAQSQNPADLSRVIASVNLDWFYLAFYPLLDRFPGPQLWASVAALTVFLAALPWLGRQRRAQAAQVHLESCNGCARCVEDCPYNAIRLQARTDNRRYSYEAVVDEALCVSCGICVGSCPTATPFRRSVATPAGIELPERSVAMLTEAVTATRTGMAGAPSIVVFSCSHGVPELAQPGVANVRVPCVGMLPPPLIDFVLTRRHADGVVLAGCRDQGCYHRLGIQWLEQRIGGERDPRLRQRVPRQRIATCWAGPTGGGQLEATVQDLRTRLVGISQDTTDG